jgi:hypothetical protein
MTTPLRDDLNPHDRATVEPLEATHIDASPGDMTRYRLTVVKDPDGGLTVLSQIRPSVWQTSEFRGDYLELVTSAARRHTGEQGLRYDRAAITALLDAHIRKEG